MSGVKGKPSAVSDPSKRFTTPSSTTALSFLSEPAPAALSYPPDPFVNLSPRTYDPLNKAERSSSGLLVPRALGNDLPYPPQWVSAVQQWVGVAAEAANFLSVAGEQVAPVVEGLARWSKRTAPVLVRAADFVLSPKTVEVIAGLIAFHELVEAHGGDLEAMFVVATKRHLEHAGVVPDSLLRSKLRQLVMQNGGQLEISYLMTLIDNHKGRLVRKAEAHSIGKQVEDIRGGIKRFPSVDVALTTLALENQKKEEVLRDMIPGIAQVERQKPLGDVGLSGRVASQIRREGIERPDDPGRVFTPGPDRVVHHADELELAAFADRELVVAKANAAGLTVQEVESWMFSTVLDSNEEAAALLGRPSNQVRQEKFRASNKLRNII
jgi:hypothetical protein